MARATNTGFPDNLSVGICYVHTTATLFPMKMGRQTYYWESWLLESNMRIRLLPFLKQKKAPEHLEEVNNSRKGS